jgi:hypothetical protein
MKICTVKKIHIPNQLETIFTAYSQKDAEPFVGTFGDALMPNLFLFFSRKAEKAKTGTNGKFFNCLLKR